jgi:hypothetical protein
MKQITIPAGLKFDATHTQQALQNRPTGIVVPGGGDPEVVIKGKQAVMPTPPPAAKGQKLHLTNFLSPGDCLVMTGAIECLRTQHPGKYRVQVSSSCNAIYENNPGIDLTFGLRDPDVTTIGMEYPLIHQSGSRPVHFIQGYVDWLAEKLNIKLNTSTNRPHLFLSSEEQSVWVPQIQEVVGNKIPYWVINAGTKQDYTAKGWGRQNYQEVVNKLRGRIQFVQIGEAGHLHKPLDNVINMLGKTDARQLIRLCWHASGGLGPITFLQHIFAAYEKPYVALLGGRETLAWEHYPTQTTMSTIGQLSCCRFNGCWKSRVVKLNDNDPKDQVLCEFPTYGGEDVIPKCMAMISPDDVIKQMMRYYEGGVLKW